MSLLILKGILILQEDAHVSIVADVASSKAPATVPEMEFQGHVASCALFFGHKCPNNANCLCFILFLCFTLCLGKGEVNIAYRENDTAEEWVVCIDHVTAST